MESKEFDAVVIGAGNGGLTAALALTYYGQRPLVLEQHNVPGGFASSFVRGRFEFEPSLHELREYGPDDDKGEIRKLFESHGVYGEFYPVPDAYRLIIPGEIDVRMPFGIEAYKAEMERLVPGSSVPVEKYFQLCEDTINGFAYIGASGGNPDPEVLKKEHPNFLKTNPYSLGEVLDAIKMPKRAQLILSAYWCYLGLPVSKLAFSPFAAMFLTFIRRGAYLPKWRSHQFTNDLAMAIEKKGGKILYNTKCSEIVVENGGVAGVRTSQGDYIECRHIVANTSMHQVYNELITPKSEVPPRAYQNLNARNLGMAGFVVYCGLNKSVDELGITDYSYFIYPKSTSEETYQSFQQMGKDMGIAVTCLNRVIPDASPEGTCIFEITTLFESSVWDNVKDTDYHRVKTEIGLNLVRQFERSTGLSLEPYIEEFEVATPATFANYTGTWGGAIYGYQASVWDSVMPRLLSLKEDQYIKGLLFSGGYAFKIYGYAATLSSGDTAGKLVMLAKFAELEEMEAQNE
ncbi:MAG: NAD(P)/FAD-dependent oxidoreductase [Coriobacteriales bacterium]|jgi:prolycopene isomerase|nr:NAD(P)/FAD-dependent oxidoreductase [Coriobacteriales bacterium]